MDKEVENLDGHSCPKTRHLVDPEAEEKCTFSRNTLSDTGPHCADGIAKKIGS